MRNPNIDKILVKGSPKQRILLYVEAVISQTYGQPPHLLSEVELKRLSDSFKTDHEIEVFNKAMGYFRAIAGYLLHIETIKNEYQARIHNLRGLCLLWMEYNREEETYNRILYTVEDKSTKDRIRKIIKDRWIVFADAKTDKEGFIEIVTDTRQKRVKRNKDLNLIEEEVEGINLQEAVHLLVDRAGELLTQVKTMANVVYSFMEKTYDIKGFRNLLKDFEGPLYNNLSPLPVFNKSFWAGEDNIVGEALSGEDAQIMKEFRQREFKDKEEIYSKYWVFPDYEEQEIDQEFFNEQYENFFKPVE